MFSREELGLLILMALVQFTHVVDFMIIMPLGPVLMKQFAINSKQFSYLVSSYTIAASISGFLAIFYLDRFNKKSVLLSFFAGFGITTMICGFSQSYEFMLIARFATGIFGGVIGAIVFAIVSDIFVVSKRGSAMGIVMSGFSLASVMGVPVSLLIANKLDWHAPFFALSAFAVIMFVMMIKIVPSRPTTLAAGASPLKAVMQVAGDRAQVRSLFFIFILFFGQFIIIPFVAPSLVSNAGLSQAQLPLVYLFGGLASIVASPVAGRLSDRFKKADIFAIAAFASAVPVYLITNLQNVGLLIAISSTSLLFFIMSFRSVPAVALVSETSKGESRGAFMSIQGTLINFAAAVAAIIAGKIVVTSPTGVLENYALCGWLSTGVVIFSIFLSRRIHLKSSRAILPESVEK
jgi:DHA1 family inner membrane transport protein